MFGRRKETRKDGKSKNGEFLIKFLQEHWVTDDMLVGYQMITCQVTPNKVLKITQLN